MSGQPYPTPTFSKLRFELSTYKNLSCKREAPDTDFLVPEAACVRELLMYYRNNHKKCKINLASFNTRTHTQKKKKKKKKKRKKKEKTFIMVTMAYFTIRLSACLSLKITIYVICAVFVSLISFVFVSFFFMSFVLSVILFFFSFLDRNIYLRGASSIGTLRHETFSLDMEKGSKSQTLV